MARTVTDMTILLEVIVGPDPEDAATARSAGHIPSSYQPFLKQMACVRSAWASCARSLRRR